MEKLMETSNKIEQDSLEEQSKSLFTGGNLNDEDLDALLQKIKLLKELNQKLLTTLDLK